MASLSTTEAKRALALANLYCVRIDEGLDVVVSVTDLELVALGLFLVVHLSEHAGQIEEFSAWGEAP